MFSRSSLPGLVGIVISPLCGSPKTGAKRTGVKPELRSKNPAFVSTNNVRVDDCEFMTQHPIHIL